jgi:hypothetical protein
MSDMMTHWAVFDDSRRLMAADGTIEPVFSEVAEKEQDIARLGALTRGGMKWMQPLLELARDTWADPAAHPEIDRRLAFVVGGITHQACDSVAKYLLSRHAGSEWNLAHHVLQKDPGTRGREHEVDTDHIQEVSAYYDAHVFRKVYLEGREAPFNALMLAKGGGDAADALEQFIGTSFQRALLTAHTLVPPPPGDMAALLRWQDAVFSYMQPRYLHMKFWVEAFNNPDPAKQAKYAVETEFYRDSDPAIVAARKLQSGATVSQAEIEDAAREGANESMYGQALELSARYMRSATAFWHRKADALVAPNAYVPKWQAA